MSKRAKTFNQILPLQNKISSRGVQKAIAVAIGNFDKEIVKIVTNFLGCGWVCTPDRYRLNGRNYEKDENFSSSICCDVVGVMKNNLTKKGAIS
jgi:hypothetical protein